MRNQNFRISMISALLLSAGMAACSSLDARPGAPVKAAGGILTGNNGMTLYTFDRDSAGSGKSVCNDACATNWPPLLAAPADTASGDYSIVTRDDGRKQWAVKGKPLYFWIKDQKPGDATGDGVNNAWRVARP